MDNSPKLFSRAVLTLFLLPFLAPVLAGAEDGAVKEMMRGLEVSLALIESGIAESDPKKVADGANWIAKRPEPGFFVKARTLAELGSDAPRFKKADETMRMLARAIEVAATQRDPDAVRANAQLLKAECHNCHQQQKPPVNMQAMGKSGPAKQLKKENRDE